MSAAFANALASIKATLSGTFPPRDVQVTVDSTLHQLEVLVVSLRHHRNQFAPVSRLPNEVLGMIFVEFSLYLWKCSLDQIESGSKYDLGTVTMVCSRWRDVSLSTPRMWCRINLYKVPLASLEARLARCKATDIHLYLRRSQARRDAILPLSPRITSITVVADGVSIAEDVLPLRRRRTATTDEELFGWAPKHFSLISSSPSKIFSRFFPSSLELQTLRLHNADLDNDPNWNTRARFPHLPSLKRLKISHVDRRMGFSRRIGRGLLDVLSRMPLVEDVELEWEGHWIKQGQERNPWHPGAVGDTLLLRHLKKLSLCVHTPVATSILRTIRSGAPLEKLEIHCTPYAFVAAGDHYEVERMEDFVDALTSMPIASSTSLSMMSPSLVSASFFLQPGMEKASEDLERLHMPRTDATTIRLCLYTTTARPASILSPSCPINLSLLTPAAHLEKADVTSSIISTFWKQLQTVTHVEITGGFLGRRFWEALACLPSLSSLTFHCSLSFNVFLSFFLQAHELGDYFLLSCPALFPALKQVTVGEESLSDDSKDAMQRLMKIFDERHRTAVFA